MPVADGAGKGVGEGFAHAEGLHGGQGVVEGVRVRAVGTERQRPVEPRFRSLGQEAQGVVDVDVTGRGQNPGRREREIFGNGSCRCGGCGSVIGAADGYGQGARADRAVVVDDAVAQGVGKRFPGPE